MSSITESLYRYLPSRLQDVAVTTEGLRLRRQRYGGEFRRTLSFLRESQTWPEDRLRDYQSRRLRQLVRHCVGSVPYYSDLFAAEHLSERDVSGVEELDLIPVLSADRAREVTDRLVSRAFRRSTMIQVETAGTTGQPMALLIDRASRQRQYAFYERFLDWAGLSRSSWSATFGGRVLGRPEQLERRPYRVDLANRNLMMSSYGLGRDSLSAYARALQAYGIRWIHSYASSAWILTRLALQTGTELPPVDAVVTTSESLGDGARADIEEGWGTRVCDYYSAAEQAAFISQCEFGTYHIHPEHGIVELHPVGRDTEGRTIASLVCTSFTNLGSPLLRYDIGDTVTMSQKRVCPCDRSFPAIDSILGRASDLITTPSGRIVGNLGSALRRVSMQRCQLSQTAPNRLVVSVVPGTRWDDQSGVQLIERLRERLGPDMEVSLELVAEIPPGPRGKHRLARSEINAVSVSPSTEAGKWSDRGASTPG